MKRSLRRLRSRVPTRFSLRWLLIAVSAIAVWLGWWVNGAQQQRMAVAWVKQLRGTVYYDHHWQQPSPGASGWLKYVDGYWNRSLGASANPLRQWLGDDYFLTVRGAEFFWFNQARIGDADLQRLADFPALRTLSLDRMGIGDAGLVHVGRLTTLRTLVVFREDISNAGLEHLTNLEHLESLFLHCPRVTDDGLKSISQLRNLRVLRITESGITGEGLTYLRDLRHLEYLAVCQSPINATGLESAQGLIRLKELDFSSSKVSNVSAQELRQALPGCKVNN